MSLITIFSALAVVFALINLSLICSGPWYLVMPYKALALSVLIIGALLLLKDPLTAVNF